MTEPTVDFNIDETTVSVNVVAQKPAIINYDVAVPYVTLVTQADWTEEDPNAKGYIWNKPVLSSVATTGNYNDLSNTPAIPSQTSDLLNDSGFITKEVSDLLNYTLTSDLATVATTGSYNDLLNTPSLPTSNDFIPQVPNTQVYQNKLAGSTITDASNRVLPALNYAAGNGYIGFGLGDQYRHLLFTEYNATLYANTLNFKSDGIYTVNSKGPISLGYADNYNRKIMLDLVSTSSGAELLLRKDATSTPILVFPTNDEATINLPKGLSILAQQTAGSTMNFVSSGKIQIVNTSTGGIEIIKSAQSIKLQDSGILAITNGSGQTDIVGTGGVNVNGASNAVNITGGGGIAVSGPTFTFNTKTIATLNDIPSLTGYATESYVGSAVSTHNQSNTAHSDIRNEIGTVRDIAEGANIAIVFNNYSDLVTFFNSESDSLKVGTNLYVKTIDVPDLWVASVESTSVSYTYTTDADFLSYINNNGQIGYYKFSELETQKVDLSNYATLTDLAGKVSKSGDTMTGNLTLNNLNVGLCFLDQTNTDTIWKLSRESGWLSFRYTQNNGSTWNRVLRIYNTQGKIVYRNSAIYLNDDTSNSQANKVVIFSEGDARWNMIQPDTSSAATLVEGKLNTLGTVDYSTIALPATPGTAEYNGTFTSTTSGDITVSLPLTYWIGDTDIVTDKTYSFSIQNGVGFIIQLD